MAAVDYYLKLDGVEGEATGEGFKGQVDVESWSWGCSQQGTSHTGGGGGAGKVAMQDFHFVMKCCKASAKLMLACASGQHIKEATLTCRKAGGKQQAFMVIKLQELLVSSYQTGGSGHSDILPTDQISLNFAKVEIEYKEQKADGSLGGSCKAGWDVKAGKKI